MCVKLKNKKNKNKNKNNFGMWKYKSVICISAYVLLKEMSNNVKNSRHTIMWR
jgi:hypothetical protein